MAFLCQYILNINCLWKFLSKIVLFIAYLGFLLSQTVSIPIFSSRTKIATLTPCYYTLTLAAGGRGLPGLPTSVRKLISASVSGPWPQTAAPCS